MSKTYSIACTKCKQHLWVAQGNGYPTPTNMNFYSGEKKTMKALEQFFIDHFKHPLIFDDNCEGSLDDYDDVTPD